MPRGNERKGPGKWFKIAAPGPAVELRKCPVIQAPLQTKEEVREEFAKLLHHLEYLSDQELEQILDRYA